MTPTDTLVDDADIDIPITDREESERQALQLAAKLREVAVSDPAYAQLLLDELVERLDSATDGKFREYVRAVDHSLAAHSE
ncbi:hypothetical protein [Actinoplanes sp. N902-109]|uniref:hypothetical protein n=1 Tax=Actinoplanes sp. (strain N902-109) TaxID=649831 RepID=UPI00032944BB|nr:hypothetical protein [Actinoplanes sp. N902-109]AGL13926.1 hypothetical protein L083_0416 [Actinoplanes sp. N902-109]